MWFKRVFGSKDDVPAPPASLAAGNAQESAEQPPADIKLSEVDTRAIVQRVKVEGHGPTYAGKPIPFYPNRGLAVPAADPRSLLDTQAELVKKIHQASGFSYADFGAYLMPVLANYAEFVHLLPASENHHHWDIGGLLRHGLECAFYAARKCEGSVFALDFTPSQRKALEPRYRMCAILGALMHDLGKPLFDVGAVDESGELQWDPHVIPLHAWLQEHKLHHYFITWRHGARGMKHEAFTTAAVYRIVPEETLRWIGAPGSQKPFSEMLLAMTTRHDDSNPLVEIIKFADRTSVAKDIQASRERLAETGQGGLRSLAARLVRSVHDRILSGEWRLNRLGDPVWYTEDGIVAVFPEITRRMIDGVREGGDQSIAYDAMQILEILSDYGFTTPSPLPNGKFRHTWEAKITVEDKGKTYSQQQQVVRFITETILPQATVLPPPVKVEWITATPKQAEAPAAQAGQDAATPAAPGPGPATESQQEPIVLATGTLPPKPSLEAPSEPAAAPAVATVKPVADAGPAQEPPATAGSEPAGQGTSAAGGSAAGHEQSYPHLYPPDMLQKLEVPEVVGGEDTDPVLPTNNDDPGEGELQLTSGGSASATVAADDPDHPYFRDRSAEVDYSQEKRDEARELLRSDFPPATPEDAHHWLKAKRPLGIYLQDVAAAISSGKLRVGEHAFALDDMVNLKFPLAFEGLGADVYELRTELSEIGWLERDPASPARQNVTITHPRTGRPVECLRLTADMSKLFMMICGNAFAEGGEGKDDAGQQGGNTLGPYLTVDDIGSWTAMTFAGDANPEVGAVLRHAVYRFLKARYSPDDDTMESLTDLDERLVKVSITDFIGSHRGMSRGAVHNRCVEPANPLFVITQFANAAASRWELRVNPTYTIALDAEVAERVRQRIVEEQNA